MYFIRKALITCLVFATIVWSAPSADSFKSDLLSRIHTLSGLQQRPDILAKKADLQWRQIGAIHYYYNSSNSGEDTLWNFSARDTIIYNAAGNEIVSKSSLAKTGWGVDSLISLDSNVYKGGRQIETVSLQFYDGEISYGNHDSTAYLAEDKGIVSFIYYWNDSLEYWRPEYKDSSVIIGNEKTLESIYYNWNEKSKKWAAGYKYTYKASIPITMDLLDHWYYQLFTEYRGYKFDTASSSWRIEYYSLKVDSECNATTAVFAHKDYDYDEKDSLVDSSDFKQIMTFNSSTWTEENVVEDSWQDKDPETDKYFDLYKDFNFKDSHQNDTLSFNCQYDTSTLAWDTSSMYRHTRAYDANGNNITTVKSYYGSYNKQWSIQNKDENLFAQINVPVTHPDRAISGQNISMLTTATFIRFSAPDITSLYLYNTAGRLVATVNQNAASSITLSLSQSRLPVSSGSYIARLICKKSTGTFPVVIKR